MLEDLRPNDSSDLGIKLFASFLDPAFAHAIGMLVYGRGHEGKTREAQIR